MYRNGVSIVPMLSKPGKMLGNGFFMRGIRRDLGAIKVIAQALVPI